METRLRMKIKSKKNSKAKRLLLVVLVLAAVLLAGSAAVYSATGSLFGWTPFAKSSNTTDNGGVNYASPSDDEKRAGEMIKSESQSKESSDSTQSAPDGQVIPIALTITAANQNGSLLQLRTLIDTVTSSGSCTLKMTKGSTSVTKSVGVQALASASTCKGFDIPVSELSAGSWTASVHFENSTVKGDAAQTVLIK